MPSHNNNIVGPFTLYFNKFNHVQKINGLWVEKSCTGMYFPCISIGDIHAGIQYFL